MKIETQTTIIGGIFGFTIGVICMFFVQTDQHLNRILQNYEVENVIRENINTCEDIIEWMNEDIWNERVDSSYYENYIYNLEIMSEENRNLLRIEYDY
jgi:hypothetical protein|tara:strand:- start:120 stop:413 length:294 start_codon:yes stop_codon:yes gene_type:complete